MHHLSDMPSWPLHKRHAELDRAAMRLWEADLELLGVEVFPSWADLAPAIQQVYHRKAIIVLSSISRYAEDWWLRNA